MMTLKTPVQARSKLPDVGTTIFTVIGQLSAHITPSTFLRARRIFPATRN
jgi:hypothetical protein